MTETARIGTPISGSARFCSSPRRADLEIGAPIFVAAIYARGLAPDGIKVISCIRENLFKRRPARYSQSLNGS